MYYVPFVTPECRQQADNYSLFEAVMKIAEKIEYDQSVLNWENFLPSPIIRKKVGRNYRLIAVKRYIESVDVNFVSIVALLTRSSNMYLSFVENATLFCESITPSDQELIEYYNNNYTGKEISPLEPPSESEQWYLYDNMLEKDDETNYIPILESKDWVQRILEPPYQEYLHIYYNLLDKEISIAADEQDLIQFGFAECQDTGAAILYFAMYDEFIYLAAPFLPNESEETTQNVIDRYMLSSGQGLFYAWQNEINSDAVAQHSRRKYPELIRADRDLWLSIQKNETGNLALSTEEYAILESLTEDANYPLFINGRPGSGKSTILMYLFAEHLYKHLRRMISPDEVQLSNSPLYLTYSSRLLDVARDSVFVIMKSNHNFALNNSINFQDEQIQNEIESSFWTFHDFLLTLLDADTHKAFTTEKRVEYPEFRNLWDKQRRSNPNANIRALSSELVWHVIRTYIKGMRDDTAGDDSFFDVDNYHDLPKNLMSVDLKTYKLIYDAVWRKWYKPLAEEQGYWDSQDLAHTILDSGINLATYPAIFCDEAQDFTRVELELILNLSIYAKRVLHPNEVQRVPFAFAGDPFQTLNPTGFDWDAVSSGFYEKLIEGLDRYGYGKEKFNVNYQSLEYNYRTTQNVVGFCNLIQLWRGNIFDIPNLKPQKLWFKDRAAPVNVFFRVDNPICQNALKEQSEIVIILPCQEGEEDDYVKSDPLLRSLTANEETARNFLSPMSAKGLEFSRVVLYKFGEEYTRGYQNLFDPIVIDDVPPYSDSEEILSLQYFMNRLYVAASRPTKRLIIVDTNDGIAQFWSIPQIQDYKILIEQYDSSEWKEEDLAYITQGMLNSFERDRDNPLELAKILYKVGIVEKSPYKLKLASANFIRANREQSALECDAERAKIEGDWLLAGDLNIQLGNLDEALDIYWQHRYFSRILRSEFEGGLEHQIADFLHNNSSIAACKGILNILQGVFKEQRQRIQEHLQETVDKIMYTLAEYDGDNLNYSEFYRQFMILRQQRFIFSDSIYLAELAYQAQYFEDACTIWAKTVPDAQFVPEFIHQHYYHARLETTPFPEKLEILDSVGDTERILAWWSENHNQPSLLEEKHHQRIVWYVLLKHRAEHLIRNFLEKRSLRSANRLHDAMLFFNEMGNSKAVTHFGKDFLRITIHYIYYADNQTVLIEFLRARMQILSRQQDDPYLWSADYHTLRYLSRMENGWRKKVNQHTHSPRNERRLYDVIDDYLDHIANYADIERLGVRLVGEAIETAARKRRSIINYYEKIADNSGITTTELEQKEAQGKWLEWQRIEIDYLREDGKESEAIAREKLVEEKDRAWNLRNQSAEMLPIKPRTNPKKREFNNDQIQAIKMFYEQKWEPERIASAMNLPLKIVEQAIETLEQDDS